MLIRTKPEVYLTGFQQISESELDRFLSEIGVEGWDTDVDAPGEKLIEVGGRTCYLSFAKPRPGGNSAYIQHIKEVAHGSVLEHAVYTFIVTGVSRSLSHELVRHRVGMSPSQLSQRYVDEGIAEYVCPLEIQEDPEDVEIWQEACERAHEAYRRLVVRLSKKIARRPENACAACGGIGVQHEKPNPTKPGNDVRCEECKGTGINPERRTDVRKAARGAARSVLPNATETKLQLTFNARALRHFFDLRAQPQADSEIRRLAVALWEKVKTRSPNIFADYTAYPLPDGTQALQTPYPKV